MPSFLGTSARNFQGLIKRCPQCYCVKYIIPEKYSGLNKVNTFRLSDLQMFRDQLIGGGSFGRVFCGKYQNIHVAVKSLMIYFDNPNDTAFTDFKQEADILL